MNSPAHFVIGAAVCRYTRSRPLGFVLALASHFALDALPHLEQCLSLPQPLRALVAPYWLALGLAAQLLVVPLVALCVWRLLRLGQPWRTALYVVAGGLFACVPDLLTAVVGGDTLLGQLNESSHTLWHQGLTLALRADREPLGAIATVLLLTEAAVFATGLWLLLRRGRQRTD